MLDLTKVELVYSSNFFTSIETGGNASKVLVSTLAQIYEFYNNFFCDANHKTVPQWLTSFRQLLLACHHCSYSHSPFFILLTKKTTHFFSLNVYYYCHYCYHHLLLPPFTITTIYCYSRTSLIRAPWFQGVPVSQICPYLRMHSK